MVEFYNFEKDKWKHSEVVISKKNKTQRIKCQKT